MTSQKNRREAAKANERGLTHYENWELEQAIAAFEAAIDNEPDNPEYHLNLARTQARAGNYGEAMQALGQYLHSEKDQQIAGRYERLFSSALDEVEELLINTMRQMKMPVQQIGKAMQMWLEFRITIGRQPLRVPKPALWSAAITYAIIKINFLDVPRADVAQGYGVSESSLKQKYNELVQALDLMPADYRYFTGDKNPLDKLVEAAQLLEDLDRQFQDD